MTTMSGGRPFTLYSDFNCPFCYALHERLHERQLIDRCAWRGVEHSPHLPRPLKPWQGSRLEELRHEVTVVRRLAPDLAIVLPEGKPKTRDAIVFTAERLGRDAVSGMSLIRAMYRAFWLDGRDISDPRVLEDVAGGQREQPSSRNGETIAEGWALAWKATGETGVPLIVAPDERLLLGCVPSNELVKFFDHYSTAGQRGTQDDHG